MSSDMYLNTHIDDGEDYMEHDSLSSDSFSKDSLQNGHNIQKQNILYNNKRRRSYTQEESPRMITSIITSQQTQPEIIQTDRNHQSCGAQRSFNKANTQKCDMSQSMYERPWVTSTTTNALSSANAKLREEKLRMAKEDQQRKLSQKIAGLNESEKLSENARRRKEIESQKKIEEKKRKDLERQRIVDERKERLIKAEEARRKTILRKLVNHNNKKPSPHASNTMMTMSCYGGFVSAKSKPGNKEVVYNRFNDARPTSSTGKVIGFGSSSPRPICENTIKLNNENKKIPEAILIKCELLSRPLSSRLPDKMTTSIIGPQFLNTSPKKPLRQNSLKERKHSKGVYKQPEMMASMMDFSSKTKLTHNTSVVVKDSLVPKINKVHSKQNKTDEARCFSALSISSKKSEESFQNQTVISLHSGTFTKNKKRSKVDTHLDSDSIDEEGLTKHIPHNPIPFGTNQTLDSSCKEHSKITEVLTKDEKDFGIGRAAPTKDLSEAEYKARLMENRRLVREKREKERELLIKTEREKRHAEEIATRELMEIERDDNLSAEEAHFTTSNDDTLDGPVESRLEYMEQRTNEELQLSEIAETPSLANNDPPTLSVNDTEEKNERKKKLNSIMSRVRKTNEESSSDGGVSPRRAMSPEQVELETDINNSKSLPAFRSSLLQSMVNKGRLTNTSNPTKDSTESLIKRESTSSIITASGGVYLTSLRESVEDSESQITPSFSTIHQSEFEGNSLPDNVIVEREDCDGKEDSISLNDYVKDLDYHESQGLEPSNDVAQENSVATLTIARELTMPTMDSI